MLLGACGAKGNAGTSADSAAAAAEIPAVVAGFSADSAYRYVAEQVAFGPRVPNSEAHRRAGDWLASRLEAYGAEVVNQRVTLRAFDGTQLQSRNILGRYNPEASERMLLLAHWDCRPWADQDADPARHSQPVDGANDGASGVGVLLEIARQLSLQAPSKGVDILFLDAEDWGDEGDEDSWALGAREFVENPPVANYAPSEGILLDMVGGENARFRREYFSQRGAPALNNAIWSIAAELGYSDRFPDLPGGAITDDHVQFLQAGIPVVDIIEFGDGGGFNSRWHTSADNMEGISAETLGIVGSTVMTYLRRNY